MKAQKDILLKELRENESVNIDNVAGVKNPRQQVYFLRQDGHNIICSDRSTYKIPQFDKLMDIVDRKYAQEIGGYCVDMQTANAVKTVYESLNEKNKPRYMKFCNENDIRVVCGYTWDLISRCSK